MYKLCYLAAFVIGVSLQLTKADPVDPEWQPLECALDGFPGDIAENYRERMERYTTNVGYARSLPDADCRIELLLKIAKINDDVDRSTNDLISIQQAVTNAILKFPAPAPEDYAQALNNCADPGIAAAKARIDSAEAKEDQLRQQPVRSIRNLVLKEYNNLGVSIDSQDPTKDALECIQAVRVDYGV